MKKVCIPNVERWLKVNAKTIFFKGIQPIGLTSLEDNLTSLEDDPSEGWPESATRGENIEKVQNWTIGD